MAQVFPTKANLMATQKSLELARQGFELMDRKRSILVREMMQLVDEAKQVESQIGDVYRAAYEALRLANITLGLCGNFARSVPVDTSLDARGKSVMGVEIPLLSLPQTAAEPHYGFHRTNSYLDEAFRKFNEAKALTVRLAETQASIFRLADAVKKTQKRANALQNILIPQFEVTVKFITEALDEKEREDFTRLKVVKSTKQRAAAEGR